MPRDEKTSKPIAALGGRYTVMSYARWLTVALSPSTFSDVKRMAASALTQSPDRKR